MRLLIGSGIQGMSGYAKSLRELGVAIKSLGTEVCAVNIAPEPSYLPEKCYTLLKSNVQVHREDIYLFRPYFEPFPSDLQARKIGFIALESTRLPERMVRDSNREEVSQIWVPSEHCKKYAIESGIIEDKIRVVPHGYDPTIFKPIKRKGDGDTPFTFLFVGGYTGRGDRKGADLLAQVFNEEFKDENVRLIFKINTNYGPFPFHDLAISEKIYINTENFLDSQMNEVYAQGDCFVSPSYGEAFNMTVLEAMACGLPVISNSNSGEQDYLWKLGSGPDDKRKFYLDGFYVPARYSAWDIGKWYKPNWIKDGLRWMYENKPPIKKYKDIEKWTWEAAGKKAIKCLDEL